MRQPRRAPASRNGKSPRLSAVVATLNEGANLRPTVEHLLSTLPENSEILVVDDGSTDGSADFLAADKYPARLIRSKRLGSARARNFGARRARGEILVFTDAHVTLPAGWWQPLVELLRDPSVGAAAPAIVDMEHPKRIGYGMRLAGPDLEIEWLEPEGESPYRVPILPGGCWAMRRDTLETTGGFDDGIVHWGSEDVELSLRLWLLGYELWLVPQVEVAHLFRETRPYDVEWTSVLHNKLRLAFLHLEQKRIALVVNALRKKRDFPAALAMAVESDAVPRRAELAERRVHDDSWFFDRFGLAW